MGRRLSKKFDFLSELSEHFPDEKKPILVGGSAVELYTRGMAKSIDLDLVADRKALASLLLDMNFKQAGRHFHKDRIYIEIPSDILHGKSNIVKYKSKKIKVISVEDLIVDRLCACKFWDSVYDCEQAKMLTKSYKKKLDRNYLRKRATQEDVISILEMEE